MDELARAWPDPDRRDAALTMLQARVRAQPADLTSAQLNILRGHAAGLTGLETAEALGLEPIAVSRELAQIRRLLGAKTTAHAVAEAFRRDLLS